MDKEEQTSSEKSTQVPRMGLYVLKENDKVLSFSGHYTSAEELDRKYMFNVMFVQRVCRGWIARKKVAQMRDVYAKQKDQEEDDRRLKSEEQYLRKVEEAKRCENPKTKADFDMLYNKLEEWRKTEEVGIQTKDDRTLNVARAKLVMEEAKMLSKISKNKNIANLEAKENTIRDFLYKASSPHCWTLSDGGTISIETPDTLRAQELQNLYIRLKCDDVIPEERVMVLNDLKANVAEFDCKLTKEIIDLVERETDLMERGVRHTNLGGLRRRILQLYLQYVRYVRYQVCQLYLQYVMSGHRCSTPRPGATPAWRSPTRRRVVRGPRGGATSSIASPALSSNPGRVSTCQRARPASHSVRLVGGWTMTPGRVWTSAFTSHSWTTSRLRRRPEEI